RRHKHRHHRKEHEEGDQDAREDHEETGYPFPLRCRLMALAASTHRCPPLPTGDRRTFRTSASVISPSATSTPLILRTGIRNTYWSSSSRSSRMFTTRRLDANRPSPRRIRASASSQRWHPGLL